MRSIVRISTKVRKNIDVCVCADNDQLLKRNDSSAGDIVQFIDIRLLQTKVCSHLFQSLASVWFWYHFGAFGFQLATGKSFRLDDYPLGRWIRSI